MENPELLKRMAQMYYNMQMGLDDDMFLPPADQQIIVMFIKSLENKVATLTEEKATLMNMLKEKQLIIDQYQGGKQ